MDESDSHPSEVFFAAARLRLLCTVINHGVAMADLTQTESAVSPTLLHT